MQEIQIFHLKKSNVSFIAPAVTLIISANLKTMLETKSSECFFFLKSEDKKYQKHDPAKGSVYFVYDNIFVNYSFLIFNVFFF